MITADNNAVTADSNVYTADGLAPAGVPVPVLPYNPDNQLSLTKKPKISVVKFGDGYEQRSSVGINNNLQKWQVTYTNKGKALADGIYNFFEARAGVEAFKWVPPGEAVARLFVAREWTRNLPYGVDVLQTITTVFDEVMA